MVSKKGMLAIDEIIKLTIGIVVFIGIIAVIVMFVKVVSDTIKEDQAQTALDKINYEFKKLNNEGIFGLTLDGPKGWMIAASYNREKLCICPIAKGASFCASKSKCSNMLNESKIFIESKDSCSPGSSFDKCIEVKSVPYNITLKKEGEILTIVG